MPTAPVFVSIKDTATHLGITPSAVRRLIASGDLAACHIGGRVYLSRESLDTWITNKLATSRINEPMPWTADCRARSSSGTVRQRLEALGKRA